MKIVKSFNEFKLTESYYIEPNKTWLNGKYEINDMECEINTSLPLIAFGDLFFAQGDEADKIIDEIHEYWLTNDCTVEQAIEYWINEQIIM